MSDIEQLTQNGIPRSASSVVNQNGNLVVRIDQDSEVSFEALFDTVLKPGGKKPLSVPWGMRKLPKSFFNPPSTGSKSPSVSSISHSRENSGDSAFGTITTTTSTGLQINHSRAHSSPASLQQTYASAQAQQNQHQHLRQRSYDITAVDELGPLPHGWDQATTPEGQVYFLNHIERTTTWDDPRKSNVASSQQQQCRNSITAAISSASPVSDLHSHTQQAPQLQRVPSSGIAPHINWCQQPVSPSQAAQINETNRRLQSLQVERECLKIRQQEIRQHELLSRTRTADPFLSAAGVLATAPVEHSRQESADSGLGMGNNYSLPHTPEDFLVSIDDSMDGVSEGGPADMAQEITSLSDSPDDLVPSLQLDGFGSDILNEVQTLINPNRAENELTWL